MNLGKFQVGQIFEQEIKVVSKMTVNRMGRKGADVLSTPALLGLMEETTIKASEPYLPDGTTTVGYAVDSTDLDFTSMNALVLSDSSTQKSTARSPTCIFLEIPTAHRLCSILH